MAQYILFADASIFLDAFLKRNAGRYCKQILALDENGSIELYTSSSCLLTVIYFLRKYGVPAKVIKASVTDLLKFISLKSPDKHHFLNALNLNFTDVEDAVQYQTALQIKGIDYFVTSNIKDFKKAWPELPAKTPRQFIDILRK